MPSLLSLEETTDRSREKREIEGTAERDAIVFCCAGTKMTASAVAIVVGTRRNELLGMLPFASIRDLIRRSRLSSLVVDEEGLRAGRERGRNGGEGEEVGVLIVKLLEKEESSEWWGGGERDGVRS